MTQSIGGLDFQPTGQNDAARCLIELARSRTAIHVHLANAYTISLADGNDDYRKLINQGLVFADGKPITWFSRLSRQTPRIYQVRGPQLFLDVLDAGRFSGIRHFLLGSTEEVLQRLRASLAERFEALEIVGSYSPPFRDLTEEEIADQDALIRESEADIVWVGLGTPKQDTEAARLTLTTARPAVAVGAAFDFAAGVLPVAPIWIQRAGLEWAFRLASEPKRLWRRYLFGNSRFLWSVLRRQRWWGKVPDDAHRSGDAVVISQLPPPVHGSTLMTQAFLRALDTQSIPWRLVDRRFSTTIGEVGQFSPGKVIRGLGLILRVSNAVARHRPRVAVLFATTSLFSFLLDWALSEVLRLFKVPIVLYLHTVGFSSLAQRGRAWQHAVRRLLGSAEVVVTLDESLAWDVEAFMDRQVDVIGNTLPELPPTLEAPFPLEERKTVLFLSNLIPGKGHHDFLDAALKCLNAGIDANFVLAGAASPSVAAEVNDFIAQSGQASSISYLGAVGPLEKWTLYATARAFVFPSTLPEAAPLVLLEAAACGLPIAAYPTGALVPHLATAGAAHVVDASDPNLLAGAIQKIVESPDLSEQLGTKARRLYVDSFSHSTYAASWGRLLGRFGFQQNST